MAKIMLFFVFALQLNFVLAADMNFEAIKQRIAPVGTVNVIKDKPVAAAPTSPTPSIPTQPQLQPQPQPQPLVKDSGKFVYESNCKLCHESGAAGAPILGDAAAWQPRIAKGMATLVKNATQGYKMMPPKGGCMGCSDADIEAAVTYMVNAAKGAAK